MRCKPSFVAGGAILVFLLLFSGAMAEIRYDYDELNRLIRVQYDNGTNVTYIYDELGNRLSRIVVPDSSAPDIPSAPSVPNGAVSVPTSSNLSWSGGDPDGDSVIYNLYIGTDNPPTSRVASGASTSFLMQNLSCGTTYYWSITSIDQHGAVVYGPVWHFTTADPGPPVRNLRTPTIAYSSIQTAYEAAADGDTLLVQNLQFTENLDADKYISITIDGGYDCAFGANPNKSVLKGQSRIIHGTVTMKNIQISN